MIAPILCSGPPDGHATSHQISRAFNASTFSAYRGLVHELELLRAREIVVTSNALLIWDGTPSSRQPCIDDTGVAVYLRTQG